MNEDAAIAVRSGVHLGSSLLLTWAVSIGIRILLPRQLGPAQFGWVNFADAFAATAFVLVAFGVDTQIRKEAPLRPEVGTELFGGLVVLRIGAAAAVFAAIAAVLYFTSQPTPVWQLVLFFGLAQVCMSMSGTLAALLQARGRVGGLAVINVVSKTLWGLGVFLGFALHRTLESVALSLLVAEALKLAVVYRLARRDAGLQFRVDVAAAWAAIAASLPFYLNHIAFTAYGRIDVTVLSFATRDEQQLGWYGVASTLAGLCLLVTPLIGWVLMPLFARAAARGDAAMRSTVARSMEFVLDMAIPASFFLILGADTWVHLIFGAAFAPAAYPLRVLAAMFILTYVATVSASALIILNKQWLVTRVSLGGLIVNPFLCVLLVRFTKTHLPSLGGAGTGAALAMLLSETFVTIMMTVALGAIAFDRRSIDVLVRTGIAIGLVVALHVLAAPLGPARLALDLVAYLVLVFALRAVRWSELREFARSARSRAA
jgi:O-antigen/teichoic acid export membrane protein